MAAPDDLKDIIDPKVKVKLYIRTIKSLRYPAQILIANFYHRFFTNSRQCPLSIQAYKRCPKIVKTGKAAQKVA